MDSSRRAVESYWRSRMIDGVTSDEDKVAPVYKLEEICNLLRTSHVSIVKEFSDFILKRLDHKSPVVKQKALRLIKYSVGKSGVEFKREMQRNSAAIRQLFHYKGHLDPLKGDALNKAVRDTAQEAISAIFASDNNPPAPMEDINRRIEGFGNMNFEMQTEDKKSFLSEVVGLGSASISHGLTTITTSHSLRKNDNGSYKSPILHGSPTTGVAGLDRCEKEEDTNDSWGSFGVSKNVGARPWSQDSRASIAEMTHGVTVSGHAGGKSCEERLLETIVTSGGVRLQPTRDALQVFLMEAAKLDAMALSLALESKLRSHPWQVRMKAVCVLESILRKSDDAHFSTVASYLSENRDAVVKCSESPQASLREKANKVLSLLVSEQTAEAVGLSGKPSTTKAEMAPVFQMPDLIDTGVPDDYGTEDSSQKQIDLSIENLKTSATPLVDDLFGDSLITGISLSANKSEDDPFADVSFHTTEDRERNNDLFSGLTIDDKQTGNELNMPTVRYGPELFDTFSSNSENLARESTRHKSDVSGLMDGLSINVTTPEQKQQGSSGGAFLQTTLLDSSSQSSCPAPDEALSGLFGSQTVSTNPSNLNSLFPLGPIQYNIPPNFMFNQALASQPINYSVMASLLGQQQLLATLSNFQHLGNLGTQGNTGLGHAAGISMEGGNSSPLPDIFQLTNRPVQSLGTATNSSKREETKAFDFISGPSLKDSLNWNNPNLSMQMHGWKRCSKALPSTMKGSFICGPGSKESGLNFKSFTCRLLMKAHIDYL